MPTPPPTERAEPPAPTALLWDLDNVAPPREYLASLAAALCWYVPADAPVLAAGHRTVYRSCQALLVDLGIQVFSGGRRANGADRVLIEHAQRLADDGARRFVVASNDYRFAQIARFADLHVLTLSNDHVSGRLRAAARDVTVLAHRHRGWVPVPTTGATGDDRRPEHGCAIQFPTGGADLVKEPTATLTSATQTAATTGLSAA